MKISLRFRLQNVRGGLLLLSLLFFNITSTAQWITNPDSSISFNGNVFVKTLNASDAVSIGNFRFSNGVADTSVALPKTKDSIVSNQSVAIASKSSIEMIAGTVMLGNDSSRVGIGITPSAGEKLSVSGNVGITGNIRLSNLSGTGERTLHIDSSGNLKAGNPVSQFFCATPWCTIGNSGTNPSADFLGTTDNTDLIFKTNSIERMRVLKTGEVGIGTTPASNIKLHLFNITFPSTNGFPTTLRMESFDGDANTTQWWDIATRSELSFSANSLTLPILTLSRNNSGQAGINTGSNIGANYDAPARLKLDVRGDARFTSTTNSTDYVRLGYNSANAIIDNFGQGSLLINFYSNRDVMIGDGAATAPSKLFTNGGIFSSTSHTADFGYNIQINVNRNLTKAIAVINGGTENFLVFGDGFCFARRFEVATGTLTHPDYVFDKDYSLMNLDELKAFIDKNKHLPNFLSAKQYEKDGKYDLLEMDMNLLKTSEELSLYVIELKKTLNEQNEMIKEMKKEIAELKEK